MSSVREKPPQRERKNSPHTSPIFFFSQKNTDEQNTQGFTETLSQPISQNLTAIFGSNALWYLYAGGLLWARNCVPQSSVNSVCSVREKTPQREKKIPTHYASSPVGVTSHTTPPLQSERGWGWGCCDFYKRRNCPAFLSCYFFVAKQRSS